jgi:hypothetical protein
VGGYIGALSTKKGWVEEQDKVFGPFWTRRVRWSGNCFDCGVRFEGVAKEKFRGGTSWHVHPDGCPKPPAKKRR